MTIDVFGQCPLSASGSIFPNRYLWALCRKMGPNSNLSRCILNIRFVQWNSEFRKPFCDVIFGFTKRKYISRYFGKLLINCCLHHSRSHAERRMNIKVTNQWSENKINYFLGYRWPLWLCARPAVMLMRCGRTFQRHFSRSLPERHIHHQISSTPATHTWMWAVVPLTAFHYTRNIVILRALTEFWIILAPKYSLGLEFLLSVCRNYAKTETNKTNRMIRTNGLREGFH